MTPISDDSILIFGGRKLLEDRSPFATLFNTVKNEFEPAIGLHDL